MHEKTVPLYNEKRLLAQFYTWWGLNPQAWKEQSKTKLWSDQVSHGHSITQNNFL